MSKQGGVTLLYEIQWGENKTQSWKFCLPSGSHDRAVLLYEYVGKKTVDLQHTEVPDAYRGRGIAKHLAKVKLYYSVLKEF